MTNPFPWSTATPQLRNGFVAEQLDLVPVGAKRPYRVAEGEIIWDRDEGPGFLPCPNFTGTMASAVKVLQLLQARWNQQLIEEDFIHWRLESLVNGWSVEIVSGKETLIRVSEDTLPLAICRAALLCSGVDLK